MSEQDTPPQMPAKPKRIAFGASGKRPRLDPESARRQGEITTLALGLLGGAQVAMTFLNTEHELLGGRPLDLAVGSAQGFDAVASAMRRAASA